MRRQRRDRGPRGRGVHGLHPPPDGRDPRGRRGEGSPRRAAQRRGGRMGSHLRPLGRCSGFVWSRDVRHHSTYRTSDRRVGRRRTRRSAG
jgi:hypothetical protein